MVKVLMKKLHIMMFIVVKSVERKKMNRQANIVQYKIEVKMPAYNGRFGPMAGVARSKVGDNEQVSSPARTAVNPPLRQAASTLYASWGDSGY
jgi:hypothetical protein